MARSVATKYVPWAVGHECQPVGPTFTSPFWPWVSRGTHLLRDVLATNAVGEGVGVGKSWDSPLSLCFWHGRALGTRRLHFVWGMGEPWGPAVYILFGASAACGADLY